MAEGYVCLIYFMVHYYFQNVMITDILNLFNRSKSGTIVGRKLPVGFSGPTNGVKVYLSKFLQNNEY